MKLGQAGYSIVADNEYKLFKITTDKQVQFEGAEQDVVLTVQRKLIHSVNPIKWTYKKANKWTELPIYLDSDGEEVDLSTDYSQLLLPSDYSIMTTKTQIRAEIEDVDGNVYYDEISLYRLGDATGIQIVLSNEVAQLQRNKNGDFNLEDLSFSYNVYNNKTKLTEGESENQFSVKHTYADGELVKTGGVYSISSIANTYSSEQQVKLSFSVNVLGEKDSIKTAYFNIFNHSLGYKPYFSNETPVLTYDEKGLTEEVDLKIGLLHSGDYAPVEAYEVEVLESNNIIATLTREASHWLYRISGMTADAADAVFKISSDNGDRLTKTITVKRKTENVPSLTFRAKPNKLSFTYDKNKNILEPTQTISTEILYGGKDLIGSDILEDFSINASGSSSVNVARINATEFAVGMQNTELVTKDKLHGYTVSFSGHIKLKGAPQVDINYRVQLELLQSSTVSDDLKQQILDEVQNREDAVDSAISAATDEAERIKGEVKAELEGLSEDPNAIKVHGNMVIDGTLGADKIVSNSITSGQIDAGSISAAILVADAVDAKVIKADEAFFEKVATSEFWSDSVNAADINAGSITTGVLKAERIEANSISLNHLSSSAFEGDGGLVTNTSMTTAIEASAEGIKLEVSQTYDPVLDSLNQEVKVTNVDIEYAENQSAVNAPESGWQSEAPTYKDGWFIWTRTTKTLGTVSKPNQSTQVIGPVCISGNTGVGVKSIQEYYFWHTTSAVAPSDSVDWKTAPGAWQPNLFLWTKSIITYTDGSTYSTDPMCVSGAPGADGSDSKTVVISGGQIFKYTNNYGSLTGPSSIVLSTTVQGITSPTYIWKVKSPDGAWTVLSDKTASLTVSPSGPYWSTHKQLTFRCELSSSVYDEISIVKVTDGSQGPQGNQGIQGPPGSNGQSQYFHVRYSANADGANMSTSPAGAIYMGTAITSTSAAPTANTAYAWSKILGDQGPQGNQGTPGQAGSDGKTPYLHIKYSDNGTSFTANNGETPGSWLGQYVDFNAVDSTVFGDYTWSKIQGVQGNQGIQGPVGPQGQSLYTWVKYADNASGGGMSDSPVGKKYIGFAYNKTVQQESTTATDYTWSLIEGPQGVQGPDGKVKYTWLKYADTPTTGMHDNPDGKKYMGVAYNKDTATESTNYADYQWSLIQGDDGADAYTLILSNENHSFAVESNGQPSGALTATTTVTALKGATSVTPTIGAISTGITGLTATASGATVTVTMATNVTASSTSGSFSIPITVDGKSFTKTFSWSKAIKGATGQQGVAGQAAKYVTVSGEQAFKYASGASTPTPGSITLLANVNNVSGSGQWYYLTPGGTTTNVISGQTGTSLVIAHNASYWSSHKSLTFRYLVGGVYDEITVLKLYDGATGSQGPAGSTGSTGAAGADAYSVALSNESHTFPVETSGNPSSAISTTTEIIAYKGTAAVAASSITVSVSGAPAGITTSVNSTTKAVTVTMGTSAPTATNGTFTIDVTIDGKVFAKKFSWAKAIKGNTGNTGSAGSAGAPAKYITIAGEQAFKYASGASTPSPTSIVLTANRVNISVAGQWSYKVSGGASFADISGATGTSYTVSPTTHFTSTNSVTFRYTADGQYDEITVVRLYDGAVGPQGPQGNTGSTGKGVKATEITYQASGSGTVVPTGTWSTTIPSVSAGQYLWTRTRITYTDNTFSDTFSVGMMGQTGAAGSAGAAGVGVSSATVTYQASSSGTSAPTGAWSSSVPNVSAGQYLWTRTVTAYTSGNSTTAYAVARMGADGSAGRGISSIENFYLASSASSGVTTSTSGWTSSVQSMTTTNKYLWNYEKISYTDNSTPTTTTPTIIGVHGTNGSVGADGNSITSIIEYYLATSASSGVTTGTSGWTTSVQTMTSTNKYLWNYEVIKYSKAADSIGTPKVIGVFGNTGNAGADAYTVLLSNESHSFPVESNGHPSSTVSTTTEVIAFKGASTIAPSAVSVSGAPTGITTSVSGAKVTIDMGTSSPSATSGTFNINVTVDGKSFAKVFSWSKAIKGATGATGPTGSAGISITAVDVEYGVSSSTTTAPTSWQTTTPSWVDGQYIWSRTKTTYSSGNPTYSNPACITGGKGSTGSSGTAGKGVKSTAVTYQASTSGVSTPSGTWLTNIPSVSAGQYLWTRTIITYTDNSTSTSYSVGMMGQTGATGSQGATGNGVQSAAVTYQRSSSGTSVPGGTWTTGIPAVSGSNIYLWARTITTYTNGSTSTSYAVASDGQSVSAISEEYYLSTSKTAQSGGSWLTTPPAWSPGKYMWTRSKITYINPPKTEYTTPYCDASWEAIDGIEMGGVNLFPGTKNFDSNWTKPPGSTVSSGNENMFAGTQIIRIPKPTSGYSDLVIRGKITPDKDAYYTLSFWARADVASSFNSYFYPSNVASGVTDAGLTTTASDGSIGHNISTTWSKKWVTWKTTASTSGVKDVIVSRLFTTATGWVEIAGVKFEKGNKASDWSQSIDDIYDRVQVDAKIKIVQDGVDLSATKTEVNTALSEENTTKNYGVELFPQVYKNNTLPVLTTNGGVAPTISNNEIVVTNKTWVRSDFIPISRTSRLYCETTFRRVSGGVGQTYFGIEQYGSNKASLGANDLVGYFVGGTTTPGTYKAMIGLSAGCAYIKLRILNSWNDVNQVIGISDIKIRQLNGDIGQFNEWKNSAEIQLRPDSIVNTVSSGVNNGTGIVTASTTLTKDKFEVKGAAFRVVDSSGVLALNANTSGEMFLRRKMQIGGSAVDGASMASGALEIRNDSNVTIFHANKDGIKAIGTRFSLYGEGSSFGAGGVVSNNTSSFTFDGLSATFNKTVNSTTNSTTSISGGKIELWPNITTGDKPSNTTKMSTIDSEGLRFIRGFDHTAANEAHYSRTSMSVPKADIEGHPAFGKAFAVFTGGVNNVPQVSRFHIFTIHNFHEGVHGLSFALGASRSYNYGNNETYSLVMNSTYRSCIFSVLSGKVNSERFLRQIVITYSGSTAYVYADINDANPENHYHFSLEPYHTSHQPNDLKIESHNYTRVATVVGTECGVWVNNQGSNSSVYTATVAPGQDGYLGLMGRSNSASDWIRTPEMGLIPYQSGGHGALGTSSWPFSSVHANNIYQRGSLVVESGSNSNGRYTKYADGTLICTRSYGHYMTTSSSWGGLYTAGQALFAGYPAHNFVNAEYEIYAFLTCGTAGDAQTMGVLRSRASNSSGQTSSNYGYSIEQFRGTSSGHSNFYFNILAIGRWK